MNDDLRKRIQEVIDDLQGTPKDIINTFDQYVEEGLFTAEEYQNNETSILAMVDEQIFSCNCCGWICEMGEMALHNDEWICQQCEADQNDDSC